MLKTYDVMTRALATCERDTTVATVAAIMRDRDIGDVIVLKEGKMCGIVTDRDLALQGLTGEDDPLQTPIHKFMSTEIITGEADWSLEQAAKIMAKHQIRRLPIVQDGQVVGIVSLGDLSRHEMGKNVVTKSLQAVSTPAAILAHKGSSILGAVIGLVVTGLVTAGMAWLTWNRSGKAFRKQVAKSKIYHSAQDAAGVALDKVDEAASSKWVRNLRREIMANFDDLTAALPTIEYKAPKHKSAIFG